MLFWVGWVSLQPRLVPTRKTGSYRGPPAFPATKVELQRLDKDLIS